MGEQETFTEAVLDDQKLTVYHPDGWNRASETLTPKLDQTTELVSLGTYQLSPGGDDCVQIPERAIESLGPTDAFITLQEASSGAGFPRRPESFSAEDGAVSDAVGCLDNADDIFFRRFRFRTEGRSFYAYVAMGNSASAQTHKEVWQILNALVFCGPGSPPGDCYRGEAEVREMGRRVPPLSHNDATRFPVHLSRSEPAKNGTSGAPDHSCLCSRNRLSRRVTDSALLDGLYR